MPCHVSRFSKINGMSVCLVCMCITYILNVACCCMSPWKHLMLRFFFWMRAFVRNVKSDEFVCDYHQATHTAATKRREKSIFQQNNNLQKMPLSKEINNLIKIIRIPYTLDSTKRTFIFSFPQNLQDQALVDTKLSSDSYKILICEYRWIDVCCFLWF